MSQPYPELTVEDLAAFSGRPAASYTNVTYIPMALMSARLLFKISTCLTALPDDADKFQLARFALLALADDFYLTQPNAEVLALPFNNESMGSYSYSLTRQTTLQQQVSKGETTGIMWFDLAVDQLGACEAGDGFEMSGGIDVFPSRHLVHTDLLEGRYLTYLGPEERAGFDSFFLTPWREMRA